jgi:hypothetical protein
VAWGDGKDDFTMAHHMPLNPAFLGHSELHRNIGETSRVLEQTAVGSLGPQRQKDCCSSPRPHKWPQPLL